LSYSTAGERSAADFKVTKQTLKSGVAVFALYQFIVGLVFWISFPLLLMIVLISGRHRRGLKQRLGLYERGETDAAANDNHCMWIHAASIGEVQAAAILISRLKVELKQWNFLVTTMTIHGRDFAREYLDADIGCYLAPLDVPFAVNRSIRGFAPDIYVCLETELWPILIGRLRKKGVSALLINGRISDKSISTYRRFNILFGPVLRNFQAIGAISEQDRDRFIAVGADQDFVSVTGNIKHDFALPADPEKITRKWHQILNLDADLDVFIAGSTHNPEEEMLLPLITRLVDEYDQVAMIAPRHLDRLKSLESLIDSSKINYHRLSDLKRGRKREHSLVIVDTFGDLSQLYGLATFVFIGGSLTAYGGHNVMEPAIWERVVFFGQHMDDFTQAAELLKKNGGGFSVAGVDELEMKIISFMKDRDLLTDAQQRAGQIARHQQGAANRQAALILQRAAQLL